LILFTSGIDAVDSGGVGHDRIARRLLVLTRCFFSGAETARLTPDAAAR